MCSSNTSGNLKYCNIRIWSWQRLELNSVWEKQAAKKLSCLFHVSPPQKKNQSRLPTQTTKNQNPKRSRFRFYRKPWSSFPELKAVALSGFPTHTALPTVPLESTRPRQAGTGKESSGSRAFPIPSTFYTGGRYLGARPRMAKHPPLGPARAFPRLRGPPGAPRPLTCSAIRCVSSVAGRAAEGAPHIMVAPM